MKDISARSPDSPITRSGQSGLLRFYERVGMTAAANAELDRRVNASELVDVEGFKDLM